jgi:hypothetical protein
MIFQILITIINLSFQELYFLYFIIIGLWVLIHQIIKKFKNIIYLNLNSLFYLKKIFHFLQLIPIFLNMIENP